VRLAEAASIVGQIPISRSIDQGRRVPHRIPLF